MSMRETGGWSLPVYSSLRACKILAECLFDGAAQLALFDLDVVETRKECGVAAVVAPVGINHAQLRHARVTVLFVAEIIAAERAGLQTSWQSPWCRNMFLSFSSLQEIMPVTRLTSAGTSIFMSKRLRLFHRCQTGFDRVHDVVLNLLHFLFGKVALNGDHFCDKRPAGARPASSSCTHWEAESARWSY